jgi:phage antirepressor YoqD-like protein
VKNWKTTIGGVLAALGQAGIAVQDPKVQAVAHVLVIAGTVLLGLAAKDYDVSGSK